MSIFARKISIKVLLTNIAKLICERKKKNDHVIAF